MDCLMALLYKKGPREDPRTWRHITLLNLYYNVLAKVLAKCFKSVLVSITHEDQFCMVLVQGVLHYQQERGQNVALLNLGLEKAYD